MEKENKLQLVDSIAVRYRPKTFSEVVGNEKNLGVIQGYFSRRKMVKSWGLFGPSGSGKCVIGSTMVNTDGGFYHIEELKFERGTNEYKTGIASPSGVSTTAFSYKEKSNTTWVNTNHGFSVSGTPEHKLQVVGSDLRIRWVRISEIRKGDYIVGKTFDSTFLLPERDKISQEYAKILGWYAANGSGGRIHSYDKFVVKKLRESAKIFGNLKSSKSEGAGYYMIKGLHFASWFHHSVASAKHIPLEVRTSSFDVVNAFLTSYFECDSGVNGNSIELISASRRFIQEIAVILKMVYDIRGKITAQTGWARNSKNPTNRTYHKYIILGRNANLFCKRFPTSKVARKYSGRFQQENYTREDVLRHYPSPIRICLQRLALKGYFSYSFRYSLSKLKGELSLERKDVILREIEDIKKECPKTYKRISHILNYSDDYMRVTHKEKNKKTSWVYDVTIPKGKAFMANGIVNHNTTTSRLMAMAVNCQNLSNEGEPCLECVSCKMALTGTHVDIREINAGSEEGKVSGIESLLETIKYKPRFNARVVIIDEAHLASGKAQQSLLKAVEEPPKGVMFIICTTNPEKLPSAILGRCLKLYFSYPEPKETAKRLYKICKKEFDEKVSARVKPFLIPIAQATQAQVRNSLSIMETLASIITSKPGIEDGKLKAMFKDIIMEAGVLDKHAIRYCTFMISGNLSFPLSLSMEIETSKVTEFVTLALRHAQYAAVYFMYNNEKGKEKFYSVRRKFWGVNFQRFDEALAAVSEGKKNKELVQGCLNIASGLIAAQEKIRTGVLTSDQAIMFGINETLRKGE